MNAKKKLTYLLEHTEPDVQQCTAAYRTIKAATSEEQKALFQEYALMFHHVDFDEEKSLPTLIDPDLKDELMQKYGDMVDSEMKRIMKCNLPEPDFYGSLWKYIQTTPDLPDETAREVAFWNCIVDKRIPYFQRDTNKMMRMENEVYQDYLKKIGLNNRLKMESILNGDFSQKTEQASLLYDLIENMSSHEEKVVLLSLVVHHLELMNPFERLFS